MLFHRLQSIQNPVLAQQFITTWGSVYNFTRSNSNKTVSAYLTDGYADGTVVALGADDITQSVYFEITANFCIYNIAGYLGFADKTTILTSTPVAFCGVYYGGSPGTATAVFGCSYNPQTGSYQIRRNNTVVASGSVSPSSTKRIFFKSYSYLETIAATINHGGSAFVYSPDIL